MFPILQIGPFALQLSGLFLLVGVWVGTILVEKEARRNQLSGNDISNLIFFGLIAGVVGARLGYALRFLDVYIDQPLSLLSLNPHTLSFTEGAAAGLIMAILYGQRKGLPFWQSLDAFAPGLALFSVFVGLSHLSSGDAFGAPSALPWAIELWGAKRHPSQVYEIIAALLVFLSVQRLKLHSPFIGFSFLAWVVLATISHLFLEAFRGDSVIILGGVRSAQLVSLMILIGALWGLHGMAQGNSSRPEFESPRKN